MMRKIVCTLVLVMGFAASASAVELGVRGSYWFPELDAEARVDGGGVVGTTIDVVDVLGLDDEAFPALEVYAGLGSHHFALAGMQMNFEGNRAVTQSVDFKGETYGGGEAVATDLDITMMDFYYRYDLLDLENIAAGFSLGPLFQVKYIDAEITMDSVSVGRETESVNLPIPMLGLGMHIGILADMLEARARVAGIGYSGNSVIDASAEINFTPFPFVNIGGGYRYLAIDFDESGMMVDMTLAGPFASVSIGF